jgi:hypothetical protein
MSITHTCASAEDMKRKIAKIIEVIPEAANVAMWNEGSLILEDSQNICPVQYGILRGSGYVADPEVTLFPSKSGSAPNANAPRSSKRVYRVKIGYTAKYALYVHENLEGYFIRPINAKALRFKVGGDVVFAKRVWMPPHPQAKFLEKPYLAAIQGMGTRLAFRVMERIKEAFYE